ncbi:MAG: phosphomannomutase/phosphoglucomutase [bacterium]|nr:phosphomannomutase/phosphoglucomutase [bacterium]
MASPDAKSEQTYTRYCPDQPRVMISDAVCAGRRRANYHVCAECQFNDDRTGRGSMWLAAVPRKPEEKTNMIEQVFKAYDVRATYPDPLDEDVAWKIGYAAATFLRSSLRGMERSDPSVRTLVVGRDMRKSSPSLAEALIEGVRSTGMDVIDIGMIDTPQVYFAVNHLPSCGGVQTTASHNPAHYNGFKISGQRGVPVGADTGLNDICAVAKNLARHESTQRGKLTTRDLSSEYKAFVRGFLQTPRKLKIVVDGSNGMAGMWVPILFGDVPEVELICLNMETNGEFVHEPNPLVESNLRQLREQVRACGADFGICFDGDADRLIVVDEQAEIVSCDMLTALLAPQFLSRHAGATVVYDLRSSRVVAEEIRKAGGVPKRERVGHAYMKKALASSKGVFGGELSGHFYFADNFYCDSGMLALVHVINTVSSLDRPMSELIAPLRRKSQSGERNFENEEKDAAIKHLAELHKSAKVDFLDGITVEYADWWFNVRKSNTEPLLRLNLEAETPELMEEKITEVARHLGEPVQH